jgi:outer membrane protein assembly factor BamB
MKKVMLRRAFPLAAFAALCHPPIAPGSETDWPQFRGPRANGVSLATDLPIRWSADEHIAWKVPVPGTGWSSPVLLHNRIYLTSAIAAPDGTHLHALGFDAADGTLLWNTEVFLADPGSAAAIHKKNSAASPTPIATNNALFVHFGHMGTAALDLSGKVLWRQTDLPYLPVHGAGGSPILSDGRLFFSADGQSEPFVAALDAATGALLWKTPRNSPARKLFSFSTPLAIEVDGQKQIVSPGSGLVAAYAPDTGAELWRFNYGEGYSVIPQPIYSHNLLFLSSGYDSPSVHAIRPLHASGDATSSHLAWTLKKGAPNTPTPLVLGNEIYFVSDAGIATCADARTGTVHWVERLGGNFSASPFSAEGHIYFLNESGETFVLRASKQFELIEKNALNERALASCTPTDKSLFLRTEKHLFRISQGL